MMSTVSAFPSPFGENIDADSLTVARGATLSTVIGPSSICFRSSFRYCTVNLARYCPSGAWMPESVVPSQRYCVPMSVDPFHTFTGNFEVPGPSCVIVRSNCFTRSGYCAFTWKASVSLIPSPFGLNASIDTVIVTVFCSLSTVTTIGKLCPRLPAASVETSW